MLYFYNTIIFLILQDLEDNFFVMPEYGARSTALQRKTEIYQVRQAHAGFIYGVVIVLQEEILDGAVPDEPAFFVKRHGDGAVPGTCPEGGIRPAVGFR